MALGFLPTKALAAADPRVVDAALRADGRALQRLPAAKKNKALVLAAVRSVQGHTEDARALFVEAVDTLRAVHAAGSGGGNAAATAARLATALNNFGYFLKSDATKAVAVAGQLGGADGADSTAGGLFDEALAHYTEAF